MTGSSGDGFIPTINRPGGNESCRDLVIVTNLASPQADVISEVQNGDVLMLQVASDQGPINALHNGRIAGTIISRDQVRLLACIVSGTAYEAEVLMMNGGQCQVRVRAV
jgi:hypothetical protein